MANLLDLFDATAKKQSDPLLDLYDSTVADQARASLAQRGVSPKEVKRRAAAGEEILQEGLRPGSDAEQMAEYLLSFGEGAVKGTAALGGLAVDALRNQGRMVRDLATGSATERPDVLKATRATEGAVDRAFDRIREGTGLQGVSVGGAEVASEFVGDVVAPGPEVLGAFRGVSKLSPVADDVASAAGLADEASGMIRKVAGPGPETITVRRVPDPLEVPEPHVLLTDGRSVPRSEYDAMLRDETITRIEPLPEAAPVADNVVPMRPEVPEMRAWDGGEMPAPPPPPPGAPPPGLLSAAAPPPPTDPVQKVLAALREAKPLRREQEAIYTKTRKARMDAALEARTVAGTGEAGFKEELKALSGEMDKIEFEALKSKLGQEDVDALFRMPTEHAGLRLYEQTWARDGLRKMLEGRVPTEGEIKLLRKVYGTDLTTELLDKRPLFAKMRESGIQIANIPRSLMSSFDLSAPFRQGVFFVSRPKQFFPAFAKMFKAYGSEEAYKALEDSIRNSPNFDLMHDSGLAITDLEGLASREERFATSLAEKMPVVEGSGILRTPARLGAQAYNATIGRGVRASGRAYTAFLTKLRADVFDDLIAKAEAAGLDPEATTRSAYANFRDANPNTLAKDIARFVNAGTGRGDLPEFMRGAAPALNAVFFSPKLMASRVQLMNPLFYAKLDPFVRKEALKSATGFIAFGASLLGLAKAAGADVGTNPYSSDFGKIKVGDTRLDVWGGFQQYVRMLAQVAGNKYVSATSGKETTLGEGYKPTTRYDIVMRQIESKEAPIFSFVTTMLRQQDYAGQPVSVMNEIGERLTPMYLASLVELAKENPALLPFGIPAIFGVGVQTFEAKPSKSGAVKSAAPSGSASGSDVKPTASLDPFGHDAAMMDLGARIPQGSTPDVKAQIVSASKPVYVSPDGTRVPIPSGVRFAFASNYATRADQTNTPISKWLDAMVKQKRLKGGGYLAFESA